MKLKGEINQNCILVRTLKFSISPRCLQCRLSIVQCPVLPYFVLNFFFILLPLGIILITKEISFTTLFGIVVTVLGFGFFTLKLIEANYREEQVRKELEETRRVLELRAQAKTKELEELTRILDEKVRIRTEELEAKTKELQSKLEDLEKLQKLAVGREMKMIELKSEIQRLKKIIEDYEKRLKKHHA